MNPHSPSAIPADTHPEAWRVQMRILAQMSPEQRLAQWAELNEALSAMEEAAVRRRHPQYTDRQVMLAIARKNYGDSLVSAAWPDEELLDP